MLSRTEGARWYSIHHDSIAPSGLNLYSNDSQGRRAALFHPSGDARWGPRACPCLATLCRASDAYTFSCLDPHLFRDVSPLLGARVSHFAVRLIVSP